MRRSLLCLSLAATATLSAQGPDSSSGPQDPVVTRARQLAQSGKEADSRKVLDSLLAVLTPDSTRYSEALYWRGALATTAADAERDYRRLLIEAPLSPRAEDALLQLAQLEQARGDRRGATDHLQRYLLSYPRGAARARVSVQYVRLLFDMGQQQLPRACDALKSARSDVPATSVELRNQLEAQAPRCAYVEAQPARAESTVTAPVPVQPPAAPAQADTTRKSAPAPPAPAAPAPATTTPAPLPSAPVSAPVAAPAPTGAPQPSFYSVQLGAYEAQESATRMLQQLTGKGIDARIDGSAAPFRVRVGKFTTRADAAKAAADLKAKGFTDLFITLVSPSR